MDPDPTAVAPLQASLTATSLSPQEVIQGKKQIRANTEPESTSAYPYPYSYQAVEVRVSLGPNISCAPNGIVGQCDNAMVGPGPMVRGF